MSTIEPADKPPDKYVYQAVFLFFAPYKRFLMKELVLKNAETVIIRKVAAEDAEMLLHFLQNLSAEAQSTFAPHAFDEATIRHICENTAADGILRYVAVDQERRCIAYSLLKTGIIWHDADRLTRYGVNLSEHFYGTFAPCVAEAYYGSGLAQEILRHIEEEARGQQMNRLVLWGGVQKGNTRAVRFYKKSGFSIVGEFAYHGQNLDMVKDLMEI